MSAYKPTASAYDCGYRSDISRIMPSFGCPYKDGSFNAEEWWKGRQAAIKEKAKNAKRKATA